MDVEQYAIESEKIQIMRQQVEATELLAYEQRTANLIALTNSAWATGPQIESARKELRGRL